MEELQFFCPHCGEVIPFEVDWTFTGDLAEDCPTCGHSIELTVWRDDWGDPQVSAEKGRG